jgi:hypothetical protein
MRLDGTSSWGQLLDHRERVRPEVAAAVLARAETVDPARPWEAFPLRALVTSAPVESFWGFYGV